MHNRHNAGFMVLSEYFKTAKIEIKQMKYGYGAETSEAIFLMPDTYMNNSGIAVRHYLSKIGNNPSNICVIQDDMDIEIGRLLLRFNGGDNGHNGIKSINNSIGTDQYYRFRIGVGRPPEDLDPADYLLSDFYGKEREIVWEAILRASSGVEIILRDGFVKAMNKINKTKNQSKKEEQIND